MISTSFNAGGPNLAVLCCSNTSTRNLSGSIGINTSLISSLQLAATVHSLKTGTGLELSPHCVLSTWYRTQRKEGTRKSGWVDESASGSHKNRACRFTFS